MIDLEGVEHHPALSEMVDVLCNKTQNTDRSFFQVESAYFLSKMAAVMRASINTKIWGNIPVNCFALALAPSGYGKGHSINIIEEEFMKGFKTRFMEDTLPTLVEGNLWKLANQRAARNGGDQDEEFKKVEKEYNKAGAFLYTFDSGTTPAVKQLRGKLLLAGCGAINLQIDEIGFNLVANTEVLTTFLELYDQGRLKQKLVKSTSENQRDEEVDGKTPTNMLLFGTPSKLLDGGQIEKEFNSMLEAGYARRCLFAWGQEDKLARENQDVDEIFDHLMDPKNDKVIKKWANHFDQLADPQGFDWRMAMDDDVIKRLLTYKIMCEKAANALPEHAAIQKAELSHRHSKALKLAGAYAFTDASNEVEMEHLMSAILLVEESGKSFQALLNRDQPWVRLARYFAEVENEVTHAELLETLPFYPKTRSNRDEMMNLAISWGYKNHIIIKKTFADGIEFFSGDALKETNLDEMVVSYSDHYAYNYLGETVPFDQLHQLTQAPGMHWANHHFKNEHRTEENTLPGFNMVVIDVDGTSTLQTVHELFKEYKFLTYTTKSHLKEGKGERFRLILPINYFLRLDSDDYKEFMTSVMSWLPFESDEGANKREKKWESYDGGDFHYNEGVLLDALPFIPKTTRNEQYRAESRELQSLDNLERWFAQRIASGNRNNQMIKYALALVDGGMSLADVSSQVHTFNKKLRDSLSEDEIESTIMVTVSKKLSRLDDAA